MKRESWWSGCGLILMQALDIFYDAEKTQKVTGTVDFGVVDAGTEAIRSLFLQNALDYALDVRFRAVGEDIEVSRNVEHIAAHGVEEVQFRITPRLTRMKPITCDIVVDVSYVVR
jgi:hypothetical protein